MTVTTIPVGATGQFLEGWEVNGAVRESVSLTDPTNSSGVAEIVSSQPIAAYGLPVWVQGTPNVGVAGTVVAQITSSIPFYVAQSSGPWDVRGGIAVTNVPTVNVTNVPAIQGGVAVTNTPTVNVTNVPAVNITTSIPFFVAQSSAPWSVNISTAPQPTGTTMVNIVSTVTQASNVVSSLPMYVTQSSAPWFFVETVSTNAGVNATSISLLAHLNTTVIKAGKGNLYGYQISNFGSTSLFVNLANASSAVVASTARFLWRVGVASSTSVQGVLDVPANFSTGITMFTTQAPWNLTAPAGSTGVVNLTYF